MRGDIEILPLELRMIRKIAHQDPVNLRIEPGGRRASGERLQLFLATGGTEIGPVVENMRIDRAHGAALDQRHASRERPRLEPQRGERHPHSYAMQDARLLADARALASAELMREA